MRVHSLSRRLGAAALVLTVGVGVSACGGDSGSDGLLELGQRRLERLRHRRGPEDASDEEAPEGRRRWPSCRPTTSTPR